MEPRTRPSSAVADVKYSPKRSPAASAAVKAKDRFIGESYTIFGELVRLCVHVNISVLFCKCVEIVCFSVVDRFEHLLI